MAGYTGSTDKEAIDDLVNETFGMSTVSYLMSCGPALLPSLEALQAQYEGGGTYEVTDDILTRQFEDGGSVTTKAERYIRKGTSLILSEETGTDSPGQFLDHYPVIYNLKEIQN